MDTGLPDPVREGASDEAAFKAVAETRRTTPAAVAFAAIVVVAVALLTKQPAPAAGVPTASVTPQRSLAEALTSSVGPTVVTTAAPTSGAPRRNPAATPHPTFLAFLAVPAEAGTTQLIPAGPTPVRLTISLPEGWQKASDAMYVKSNGVTPAGLSISAWHLLDVNFFPCRWATHEFADGRLMRTAEGQAVALSSWWGQDPTMLPYWNSKIAPIASKPRPVTIQGYAAWYLQVLIPSVLDLTECDGGQLILWDTANGDVRDSLPGEIHRLLVVDVDRGPIVIDAASLLATSSADVAELEAVIDSVVIP